MNMNSQKQTVVISDEGNIQALIKTIRGVQVILDRDIAKLYGVETGALNRQVKRNEERFPEDFMFRLSSEEWENLKCQIGISSWGGIRKAPKVFTEQGVVMLSVVLNLPTAILVSMKDIGKKCFGFTKMDAGEIERIKKAAFGEGEKLIINYYKDN